VYVYVLLEVISQHYALDKDTVRCRNVELKVNCCIKICSFLTARTNTLSLILRFWAHKAKERRYILFWVCTHQYIHFIENGLVSSWNLKTNNELSHSLYCFYFSNLDKSLNCFEYNHRSVKGKWFHSKILIGRRIFFTVQLIIFQILYKNLSFYSRSGFWRFSEEYMCNCNKKN